MPKKTAKPQTQTPVDDLEKTPVEIGGNMYNLCFNLRKLAEAEKHYRYQGRNVNLLVSLSEFTLSGVRDSFPCLVRTFHPELSWEQAQELVTLESAYKLTAIVADVMQKSFGKTASAGA